MKQNVKTFIVALLIGMIASYIFCYKFDNTIITSALNTKATYFYVGSYNNIEEATNKKNNYSNAIIFNDKGIYKVVIGVYSKPESIDLMESYFLDKNINFRKSTIKINSEFIKLSENYELLIASSSKEYYESLNTSLLKLFNEYIN